MKKIAFLFLILLAACSHQKEKRVFLSILAENHALVLPRYLQCIEKLDYHKKAISIYIHAAENRDETEEILRKWAEENKNSYAQIIFDSEIDPKYPDGFQYYSAIKNKALEKAKEANADYFFLVDCNSLIAPQTLRYLIHERKPIVAPMLRAIPEINDPFSNFFCDVTPNGYFKEHPEYWLILNEIKTGTFTVPLVHCTYLVEKAYFDKLTYLDESADLDFIVFSRSARENQVSQFISNEQTFGVFFHFYQNPIENEAETTRLQHILSLPASQ